MERGGSVYIVANQRRTTLYVGVTSNLPRRIRQHKTKFYPRSFTARYNCDQLVYHEALPTIVEAIAREKQLKAGSRKKKLALIRRLNPEWRDLYEDIKDW
jgi:putative endonuclease